MNPFQSQALRSERAWIGWAVLGLLGLCFLAFFNQLGTLGLMDKTEGLFAEVPRQMLLRGDWVTPRWNGETFFDYPVWGYWMVALSFRAFGISEWAARLPAAIAASVTVLALFGVVFKLAPEGEPIQQRLGRATLAGSLLALSPGWIAWGRSSVTDMFLASAITLALLGFALVDQAAPPRPSQPLGTVQHVGYGCLALFSGIAVLAKGPVGVVLPGLVIVVFSLLKGTLLAHLRQAPWLPMVALFLGVTLPWYGMATAANGVDFLSRFLGYSNFQRFTSVIYSHPGPPWFYIPWVFVFLLPWSLYLPVAVIRLRFWRLAPWRQVDSRADLSLFALVWLVSMVAFYSAAATKLAGYILPIVPAGVLLVCLLFQPFTSQSTLGQGARLTGWLNAGVLAVAALAGALVPSLLKEEPDYPLFARELLDTGLQWWLPLVLLIAGLGLVWLLASTNALSLLWLPNASALAVLLAVALPVVLPLVDRERLLPIRSLGAVAGRWMRPGDRLAVVGFKRYSLLVYANHPALFVTSRQELLEALSAKQPESSAGAPHNGTIFLFGTERELRKFGLNPASCPPALGQPRWRSGALAESASCDVVARRGAHLLIRATAAALAQSS